jgi:hypothetical protein
MSINLFPLNQVLKSEAFSSDLADTASNFTGAMTVF